MMTRRDPAWPRTRRGATSPRGSIMVVTLMAVVVLMLLALTILSTSYSEDFNQRREQRSVLAFYAADAGVIEAIARMNLNPSGANNDETELRWDTGTNQPRNPDSVRDPLLVQNSAPEPNPNNFTDSSVPTWRFWNYNPNWRYSGTSAGGEGNYPGATSVQQANLSSAGRGFSYDSASSRTLVNGSSYNVKVVPHIRNFAGTWSFADARGNQAAPSYYFYKVSSVGTYGGKTATVELILRKFRFGPNVPAAITAGGPVEVSGNGSVGNGDTGDEIASGVAIQSAGTITNTGSGTIDGGTVQAPFPGFETIFGLSKTEMHSLLQSMSPGQQETQELANDYDRTTAPPESPASNGGAYWLTPSGGSILISGQGHGGYTLGTPTQPVILIVDGDLTLNTVTIYGIVYVTGTFNNQGNSFIRGAILVEGTAQTEILGTGNNPEIKIAYSQNVMNNASNNQFLYPFAPVRGTWKINRG